MPKIICPAVPTEVSFGDDKILWRAIASSTWDGTFDAKYVIDGSTSNLWHNKVGGALHSWLQVQMDQAHWVKGIKIGVRSASTPVQKFTVVSLIYNDL